MAQRLRHEGSVETSRRRRAGGFITDLLSAQTLRTVRGNTLLGADRGQPPDRRTRSKYRSTVSATGSQAAGAIYGPDRYITNP